jgi:hypothetical protein
MSPCLAQPGYCTGCGHGFLKIKLHPSFVNIIEIWQWDSWDDGAANIN